ncbi:MAG TPA: hypothetical protein VJL61_03630 [Rhodanobacteraceae bacterium]|nr:hypothetical protein [Rhodanobacteraceae bacterium]
MHSSISSSESASADLSVGRSASAEARIALRPGLRQTAADRPGQAQPVPERDIPERRWGAILLGALAMFLLMMGAWEWHWRSFGVEPSIANSDALWSTQRRRIDHGEGDGATVLIGSSRMLFDLQLPVWQKLSGRRPIQLALEGTSPMFALEDLADDPNFRNGRLLVGVAPDIFFSGFGYRADVLRYFHKQSPSQRVGQWLSMHFVEPFLAFDDPDYALPAVLERQDWWPVRSGMHPHKDVRKLMVVTAPDRASHIWDKLEKDPAYAALAQSIWAQHFSLGPGMPTLQELHKSADEQVARAAKAVAKLRKRHVEVIFVRTPSAGQYLAFEDKAFPRAKTWDVLLAKTGAPGVHFQDHPELQGFWLPEWSHLAAGDAVRFTRALYAIVARDTGHRMASAGVQVHRP